MAGTPVYSREEPRAAKARILPFAVLLAALAGWAALSSLRVFPESVFPPPAAVARGFGEEVRLGRARLFSSISGGVNHLQKESPANAIIVKRQTEALG